MRPNWSKACYRQGAALMVLKVHWRLCWLFLLLVQKIVSDYSPVLYQDYEGASERFLDGLKLDPANTEIKDALR
jgi:hypothetical protein